MHGVLREHQRAVDAHVEDTVLAPNQLGVDPEPLLE